MENAEFALHERLLDEFTTLSKEFRTVMAEFLFAITAKDVEQQTTMVMEAYHEKPKFEPTFAKSMRNLLLNNKRYPMRRPNLKGLERWDVNGRNERFDTVFLAMMRGIGVKERQAYLHRILARQADISSILKMFTYFEGSAETYLHACVQENINTNREEFESLLKEAITNRNMYIGHRTPETAETYSSNDFANGIHMYLNTLACMQEKENTVYGTVRKQFVEHCKDWLKRLQIPPVTQEQLQQVYGNEGNPMEIVRHTYLGQDVYQQKIYFHPFASIQAAIQEMKDLVLGFVKDEKRIPIENQVVFATDGKAVQASVMTEILEAILAVPQEGWKEEQLNQIAQSTVVMADAKCWMNRFYQTFLSHTFKDRLQRFQRRFVVDKGTRLELFKVMKNVSGKEKAADIQNAKWAYNMMSMMHQKGYLYYLGSEGTFYDSIHGIVDTAKRHPDTIFSVFVGDDSLSKLVIQEDMSNVLPVKYLHIQDKYILPRVFTEYAFELLEKKPVQNQKRLETVEKKAVQEKKVVQEEKPHETEILTVHGLPTAGSLVYTNLQERVQLQHVIGSGGEGIVYGCDRAGMVVKIYHEKCLTLERQKKIQAMVDNQPNMEELCWPLKVIYNEKQEFVGFLMKDTSAYKEFGITVMKMNSKRVRQNTMAGWDRLSLVKLCRAICKTFQSMHKKQIYMGDINPRNMMILTNSAENPKFVFVDCDSYQYHDFACPVGTPPYTSPKLYKRYHKTPQTLQFDQVMRNDDDECYALASLLFGILMLNASPFQGKGVTDVLEAMMQYNFAYRTKTSTGKDTIDGPQRMIWNNMDFRLRSLFEKTFANGEYVPLKTWIYILDSYCKEIEKGNYTAEVEPVLYRDGTDGDGKPYNQYFVCVECGQKRNMPMTRYLNQEKFHLPHLCNTCSPTVDRLRRIPAKHVCSRCGRLFDTTEYEVYRAEKMNEGRMRCKACKAQRIG